MRYDKEKSKEKESSASNNLTSAVAFKIFENIKTHESLPFCVFNVRIFCKKSDQPLSFI